MFKSWRNDKKKFKAVFKLQFQATQVPHLKKPALVVSLVPEDVGKATFKLEKTAVQDGTCLWENPVYVSVKLVKELKTGKLHEKIFHFIVSSGSSKSGYLGESSIDFSEFAEETEPLTVSLPLKFANSGAVLHVTIERIHGDPHQRHFEDNKDPTLSHDGSLDKQLSNHMDGNEKNWTEEGNLDSFSSKNAEEDGSINGSNSHNGSFQSIHRQNSMPNGVDTGTTKNHMHRRSSTDWSIGSASDGSLVDSTNSPLDDLPKELQEVSDGSTERLKDEITSLMRQSELSELELQSLRKQIIKETRRAQDLSRQIIGLTEERDALKTECVQLKSSQKSFDQVLNQLQVDNEHSKVKIEEITRELGHEKELNSNLKVQIQKIQDSNSDLILAVRELEEMLEDKNRDISSLSSQLELSKNVEDQKAKPGQEDSAHKKDDANELQQKIAYLCDEIEGYRQDREKLEKYAEQLAQDYEDLKLENEEMSLKLTQNQEQEHNESSRYLATIKELESHVERLEEKLKRQTQELSESLLSINDLESKVKGLEKELEKQAQNFENDLDSMMQEKIEQEQRAIHAEETLRKTRWKNAITAERLQEEIKRLSAEMASRFNENEKLTTKAFAESNELREQKRMLEESLKNSNEQLALIKKENKVKLEELSTQLDLKTKEVEQMISELESRSKQLSYAEKHIEENHKAFSTEILKLKGKIEALTKEKIEASKQKDQLVELVEETTQMTLSFADKKTQMEWGKNERNELLGKLALAKEEEEKARDELLILRSLKEEKDNMVDNLLSDVESLRTQNIKLKHSLSKEELEKEDLCRQVLQLTGKANGNQESKPVNKGVGIERKFKGCTEQEELTIAHVKDESHLTALLTELAILKERNKSMENELKEMQERYSEISLKFAEVEGERQQLVMTVRNLKSSKKK